MAILDNAHPIMGVAASKSWAWSIKMGVAAKKIARALRAHYQAPLSIES
jgi:protein involved in ribonucleotide reduction